MVHIQGLYREVAGITETSELGCFRNPRHFSVQPIMATSSSARGKESVGTPVLEISAGPRAVDAPYMSKMGTAH